MIIKNQPIDLLEDIDKFRNPTLNKSIDDDKFKFYYLRLLLEESNITWSNSIWIVKRD